MHKRSSKKKDLNETAYALVQQVIGQNQTEHLPVKNPAAVALGRLGGLKGGKARNKALSAKRKRQIAKKAAKARWSKSRLKHAKA